jgi:hypothetical protein
MPVSRLMAFIRLQQVDMETAVHVSIGRNTGDGEGRTDSHLRW